MSIQILDATGAAPLTTLPVTSVTGMAAGMATFLAIPTSANLVAVVTDETGTGSLVFATAPTVSAPTLSGTVTLADAAVVAVGTGTGTKIGTATSQKLALWNAVPITQPANTVAIDTLLGTTGLRATGGVASFDTTVKPRLGTTAVGTAPLKFTTQAQGLLVVEQGAMELIGNSLQFTQKAKRRGVVMSQSVRVADVAQTNTTNDSYCAFTASIAGTTMTVSAISSGALYPGQQVFCSGMTTYTYIVSQTSGATGSTGNYVVNASQTQASASFTGAIVIAEHGPNYLEVGKSEEIQARGTFQQAAAGAGILTIAIRYAGAAATVSLATTTGTIGASQADLRVWSTCRSVDATTGTLKLNAELRWTVDSTGVSTSVRGNGTYTGDTTAASILTVSAAWSVASATNSFTINQSRVLCVETNR